jgi:hypothetical protein
MNSLRINSQRPAAAARIARPSVRPIGALRPAASLARLLAGEDNAAMSDPPKREWHQFSLRTLLLFVVVVSVIFAAMRIATPAWASAVISATVLTLLFSIVLAVFKRPFWIGFAICGTFYLGFVKTPFAKEFVDNLVTTHAVAFLRDRFHPYSDYPSTRLPGASAATQASANRASDDYDEMRRNTRLIGECLCTLILGTLGGTLARFAVRRPCP